MMGHKIDKPKYGDGYGLRLKLKHIQADCFHAALTCVGRQSRLTAL